MERFQILSLDGGGIKGIFSAAILSHLEEDLKFNIIDNFDLIVGTSTGGIIALALGIGISPRDIVKFYVSNMAKIFPKKKVSKLRHFIHHKFEPDPLEHSIKVYFKDKLLGESNKRLVIPSYNIGDDDI